MIKFIHNKGGENLTRKRIKVKPSKVQSKFSFIIGIIFCLIGIFVAIPSAGLFGILWTLVAAFITYSHYKNAFTEEGMPTQEIIVDEGTFSQYEEVNSVESRLKKVESLYQQGLITRDEYDQKRKELIDEL